MSQETARWLIQQRERRGWNRRQMARKLIAAGEARRDRQLPDVAGMQRNVSRWETGGGVHHPFVVLYCDVFEISFTEFPRQVRTRSTKKIGSANTTRQDHRSSSIEHEVNMTAHESSAHSADREQPGIGDMTFEQLRADIMRLSRLTDAGAPFAAYRDTHRIRDQIYRLMDRPVWPREQTDLYMLLGCAHVILGQNAERLGFPDACEEVLRSGWAYATAIDHNPLRGVLREKLASVKYWRGRYREASELAADGLRYMPTGPTGAALHNSYARSMARLGDPGAVRRAVGQAHDAWDSDYRDDLIEIGGHEFGQHLARMHQMAGTALADTRADSRDAADELERAISLYDEPPPPGEQHWSVGKPFTGTNLAVARLRSGELDGAATALHPALSLPPEQRTFELTSRLANVRDELAAPAFQDSPQARALGDQIENFTREAGRSSLHSLSG